MKKSKTLRLILIIAGSLCVALGSLGLLVPVLPTTPFLLLAAGCYIKASDRLYQWLVDHKILGSFIKGYIEGSGIPLKSKLIAIAVLWTGILVSVFLIKILWIRILLICIAVAVTVHIALIKPKVKQQKDRFDLS